MVDDDDRDSDMNFFAVTDPNVIPEKMVPAFNNLIKAMCKTEEARARAQKMLDARDMKLNQWLNHQTDDDDDELSDEEEEELLRELGLDVD